MASEMRQGSKLQVVRAVKRRRHVLERIRVFRALVSVGQHHPQARSRGEWYIPEQISEERRGSECIRV